MVTEVQGNKGDDYLNKEQEEIFKNYCYNYANRFIYTVCSTTGEGWLPKMCQFKWWRVKDELNDKYNIIIKDTDIKSYKLYESIMLEVLNTRIEQCKQEQSKRDKEAAKTKNIKRKKD